MSDHASYELKDGIAVITMHSGKVNAVSKDLIAAVHSCLDQAEQDKAVVVLAGNGTMFSAGFDLRAFQSGSMEENQQLIADGRDLGLRLMQHPAPVVAAATGHAIAMGFLLLCCCDWVVSTDAEAKYCLNEVQIGLPMPIFGLNMPKTRLTPNAAQRAVTQSEMFNPASGKDAGLVDDIVPADKVVDTAITKAQQLATLNRDAFIHTRNGYRAQIVQDCGTGSDFKLPDFG